MDERTPGEVFEEMCGRRYLPVPQHLLARHRLFPAVPYVKQWVDDERNVGTWAPIWALILMEMCGAGWLNVMEANRKVKEILEDGDGAFMLELRLSGMHVQATDRTAVAIQAIHEYVDFWKTGRYLIVGTRQELEEEPF